MKDFKIRTFHEICKNEYNEGDLETVNNYDLSKTITAINHKEAIEKYFSDFLFYSFDFELAEIDEENNSLFYSTLVDAENNEATEEEVKKWRNNKMKLFSDNISLQIFEIKPINLTK